eukprot:gene8173-22696_t
MAGEMNSPDIAAASAAPAEAGSNTAPASNTAGSAVIDTATAAVASTTSSSGGDTGTTTEGGAKVVDGAEAAKSAAAPRETRFIFKELVGKPFAPLEDKDTQGLLAKWTMLDSMRVFRYKFDQKFQLYDMETFVNDFLNDPSVLGTMKILSNTRGTWTYPGEEGKCTKSDTEPLSCTATSMAFFDRLYECGAIRSNGSLVGCMPEYVEQFTINQELGKVMLLDDSDHYDIFSEEERSELLFKLFQHLTLGGPLNQYEDDIGPYFDTDPKTSKVHVSSVACKLNGGEGMFDFFPAGVDCRVCYNCFNMVTKRSTVMKTKLAFKEKREADIQSPPEKGQRV